ncbi:MAG TPA: acyl-CoA desaturase [Bacteroidia bacterium]|nr:acyl-CoA desaturase [Bacteroidia bacterium]
MAEILKTRFGQQQRVFINTLRQRVDTYFKTNEISKHGNANMVLKTVAMFSIYLVPYFFILFGGFESNLLLLALSIVMGVGMAGIGLSVMHDANHGSYSKNPTINKFMSYSICLVGGLPINWQVQHNVLHHTYTNVHEHDGDLDGPSFLRFSPHSPRKKVHKFQFLYAWFFYGFLTMAWSTSKDFVQLARYRKMDLLKTQNKKYGKQLALLIFTKVLYYAYVVLIPMLVLDIAWWKILIGILTMHYVAGLLLSMIFQSAHIVEETVFPLPSETTGNMENDWAVHQLYTTANFAQKSRLFSWYVGGLNFQVEHHLFPNICHVHYKKIAKIVEETAREFNFPYYTQPTFVGALWSHSKLLWRLGRA